MFWWKKTFSRFPEQFWSFVHDNLWKMTPQPKGGPLERNKTKGETIGEKFANFHKVYVLWVWAIFKFFIKCFHKLKTIVLMKENVFWLSPEQFWSFFDKQILNGLIGERFTNLAVRNFAFPAKTSTPPWVYTSRNLPLRCLSRLTRLCIMSTLVWWNLSCGRGQGGGNPGE